MGAYLGISKENDQHSVSRSRAVQKRIAQHMRSDKAAQNEHQYIRQTKSDKKGKKVA